MLAEQRLTNRGNDMITDFRLKVFKTVADRLNFTKAAGELMISQPAVTKHISELEKQVGVPLFVRKGGTVTLTQHGLLMLDYANRILGLYGNLNDAFADNGKLPSGKIRLGASTTIAQYVLPGILATFRRRYPEIKVEMSNGNTEQIEALVADGRLDIGMIEGKASGHALHYRPFMQDEIVLVTSVSNSTVRGEEIDREQLCEIPLIIRENGSGTLEVLSEALDAYGLNLRSMHIEMQLGSTESIKRYLYNSGAFAFVSIQAVLDELAQNKLRIIDVTGLDIQRKFSFVSAHGNYGRLIELFVQFCLNNNRKL